MASAFFTGHRNYRNLHHGIYRLIHLAQQQGINHFYCGMAIGTDLVAATLLSNLRLSWTAVIPFPEQTQRWQDSDKRLYEQVLPYSRERIVLYSTYCPESYHFRNHYMMERSDLCLAVYDGRLQGGTANVVNQWAKDVIIYNPKTGYFIKQITANC